MSVQPGSKITARLTSLDDGRTLVFIVPPGEHDREYGAQWDLVGVCEADVEPSEYRYTQPERRTYVVTLDGYGRVGGIANTVEAELKKLKSFTKRSPGKVRAHKCLYSQGEQQFGPCFVESVHVHVKRIGLKGGALQAVDIALALKELPGMN